MAPPRRFVLELDQSHHVHGRHQLQDGQFDFAFPVGALHENLRVLPARLARRPGTWPVINGPQEPM
jgi:hypothetical protein